MSEAEKKRRADYKHKRKKWMIIQAIIIAFVSVVAFAFAFTYYQVDKTYYIDYTESGNVDYSVQLSPNDFYDEEWIEKDKAYVSSLIENVMAKFRYEIDMDAQEAVKYSYSYGIDASLLITDKYTGTVIYEPITEILPEKSYTQSGNKKLTIKENVIVDYDEYNDKAVMFNNVYGLDNTSSTLVITFRVKVVGVCNNFENNSENVYFTSLHFPLDVDTAEPMVTSSVVNGESKVLACESSINKNVFLILSIVFGALDAIAIGILLCFVYFTRNEDVNYTIKIKKILNAYRSFIQEIDGEFNTEGYQLVPIKSFIEMLGIRDTIQSPVLMWQNNDETMTQFLIPTDTKILYTFEIKVENYDLIYGLDEGERGTVLEVEDENGVEEAIIVEKDVNIEEVAAALATPDVKLEDVDYVPDNDVDYEGTEDAPAIEVVGVVWPERAHKNKVYRYDPNGENLNEGDMVLVPTKDAAKDREVIRKAAIAHGNHKIDPSLHPHTIKKIIGVIKRHAEAALTPKDENK